MSNLNDKITTRRLDVYMEQAFMSNNERLQSKLRSETGTRFSSDLSTPVRWGPWLYYRRVEEEKHNSVLCRRSAAPNEEFISHKSPWAGFDFTSRKRIEQKILDYNKEAERFRGYAYEELSEISPVH
ncbi:Peptidase S9A, N-terminal domain [Dillenia turbinata]|uniref:Peptidase S9A, N-terminal domain n=1 Tax=Dillenia turbinata TaxID=194707 RepID=A0AAN8ZF38_9MAGN